MKKGILCCILAAVGFGTAPSVLKFLIEQGMTETNCILLSNLFLCAAAACVCRAKGLSLRLGAARTVKLCLTGLMGMGCTTLLLASSFRYISVGTGTVIHFLYPTVVTVGSMVLLHKKGTLFSALAIVLSIAGMACISLPGGAAGGGALGYVLALLSSFTYSFYILGNELFRLGELPLPVTITYMSGVSAAVFLLYALATGSIALPASLPLWLIQLGYAVIIGFSFTMLNAGIAQVGAVKASFSTLVEPVTSVLCSVLFFGDKLTLLSLAGFVLVFASVGLNSATPKGRKVKHEV